MYSRGSYLPLISHSECSSLDVLSATEQAMNCDKLN